MMHQHHRTQKLRVTLVGEVLALRPPSPTTYLALPSPPLGHAPKHHIYTSFEHLQRC